MAINTVVLTGRLTRDPELRYTPGGTAVCNVSLAVDRSRPDQGGERQADFFDVVIWGKTAESVAQHQTKGKLVGVEGRLQARSYETQDGQKRKVVEVVAQNVQFLSPKGGGAPGEHAGAAEADEEDQGVPF